MSFQFFILWDLGKMASILQITFSNAFSRIEVITFYSKCAEDFSSVSDRKYASPSVTGHRLNQILIRRTDASICPDALIARLVFIIFAAVSSHYWLQETKRSKISDELRYGSYFIYFTFLYIFLYLYILFLFCQGFLYYWMLWLYTSTIYGLEF